jgi:hypothetical protein
MRAGRERFQEWRQESLRIAMDDERAAYLIVLRHVLVAEDIADALRERDPDAMVLRARTAPDALELLGAVGRLRAAVLAVAPRDYLGSALSRAVAERGGRPILMGEAAEAEGEMLGFCVLARPFTSDALLALLDG